MNYRRCPRCNSHVHEDEWMCGVCGVDLSDLDPAPDDHLEAAYEEAQSGDDPFA